MLVVRQATGPSTRLVELALAEVDGARRRLRAGAPERVDVHRDGAAAPRTAERPAGSTGLAIRSSVGRWASSTRRLPTRWTMASLARRPAPLDRRLADRFTRLVGQPPMRYLAAWRMRLAADRLGSPEATVAEAAHVPGYESEAAFSRAFKKATSVTPRRLARWTGRRLRRLTSRDLAVSPTRRTGGDPEDVPHGSANMNRRPPGYSCSSVWIRPPATCTLATAASTSSDRTSASTPSPRDIAGCGFSPPNSWPGLPGP